MASKTFDITTLAGYADVSLGSHQLTIVSEADGYIDSDPSTPVTFINGYPITFNLTHCTRTPASNAVDRFNDTIFNITADTNYKLPASITVSGSNYDWNSSTGVLTIKEVTGQVTVTIAAVQDVFAITKSATNGSWTGPSTINAGSTVTLTLTPNTNYKLPTSVSVTGAAQSWNANTGTLTLSNPTGPVNVTATCQIITYSITETLTNVSKSGTHPTTINAGSTLQLNYTAATNYNLPDTVTVTGATSTWEKSTGTLTISNPTANVSITIAGVLSTVTVTYNLTHCTSASTNPATVAIGGSADLKFVADSGYELNATPTVTGATLVSWDYPVADDKTTMVAGIENVTGPVTISVVGALPQLATPQNVSADGTTVSWDEVENATSYAVLADGSEIGTVEKATGYNTITINALFPGASYGDIYYKLNDGEQTQIVCTNTTSSGGDWAETVTLNNVKKLEIMVTGRDYSYYKVNDVLITSMSANMWFDITENLSNNATVTIYTDD